MLPLPLRLQALQQELGFDPEDPEFDLGGGGDALQHMGAGTTQPGAASGSPYAGRHMHAMEQALQRQLGIEGEEGREVGRAAGGGRAAVNGASTGRSFKDADDKMA